MNQKLYEARLKLLLNQPGLLKHYLQRGTSKSLSLKSIYPPIAQLQRFRHLQNARLSGQRDIQLDSHVLEIVQKFQAQVAANMHKNRQLEKKKENCLGKLKMDYVEQQMTENLDQLQKLIKEYDHYNELIASEKGYVEKTIMTTEIKKALMIQNNILKKQNEMLKKQEEELDSAISRKTKK